MSRPDRQNNTQQLELFPQENKTTTVNNVVFVTTPRVGDLIFKLRMYLAEIEKLTLECRKEVNQLEQERGKSAN